VVHSWKDRGQQESIGGTHGPLLAPSTHQRSGVCGIVPIWRQPQVERVRDTEVGFPVVVLDLCHCQVSACCAGGSVLQHLAVYIVVSRQEVLVALTRMLEAREINVSRSNLEKST
jgi:hypothetical protein